MSDDKKSLTDEEAKDLNDRFNNIFNDDDEFAKKLEEQRKAKRREAEQKQRDTIIRNSKRIMDIIKNDPDYDPD